MILLNIWVCHKTNVHSDNLAQVFTSKKILTETSDGVTQKGFLGVVGEKVDALDYYTVKCNRLTEEVPLSSFLLLV